MDSSPTQFWFKDKKIHFAQYGFSQVLSCTLGYESHVSILTLNDQIKSKIIKILLTNCYLLNLTRVPMARMGSCDS